MNASTLQKVEERNFILEFIKVYRDLPALWQVGNKIYNDKIKKGEAYDVLVAKYKEKYPTATKIDVKKKINSLRSNYRKELRKSLQDSSYIPSLWYHQEIEFLTQVLNIDIARTSVNVPSSCRIKVDPSVKDYEDVTEEGEIEQMIREPKSPEVCRNSMKWEAMQESLIPQPQPATSGSYDDELCQIARVWVADLAKASPQQQMFAKKAISDILFEAQMGTLHRHSVQINQ